MSAFLTVNVAIMDRETVAPPVIFGLDTLVIQNKIVVVVCQMHKLLEQPPIIVPLIMDIAETKVRQIVEVIFQLMIALAVAMVGAVPIKESLEQKLPIIVPLIMDIAETKVRQIVEVIFQLMIALAVAMVGAVPIKEPRALAEPEQVDPEPSARFIFRMVLVCLIR